MKLKALFAICSFALMLGSSAMAQVKIGYTNVEAVLANMPDSKLVEKQLETYQKKLSANLKIKDDYVKQKYQEYLDLRERGTMTPEEQQRREAELLKLDEEVQKLAADAEYDLMAKQQELMEPILEKLQNAINAVAKAQGFTYVLNQTTSAGVSTILYGPEENDITEAVFKQMGIPLPTAPASGGK
jgi:outer membrane protein